MSDNKHKPGNHHSHSGMGCCHHDSLEPKKSHKPESDSNIVHTCPIHPEIRKRGSGDCPVCGVTLNPDYN